MIDNNYLTVAEGQRSLQPDILAAFDDIAQICLKLARSGQGSVKPLQDYLDGWVKIGGVSLRRRTVLLSIHDMKKETEAPLTLQRKVLAQVVALKMHPIPKLMLYRDIATALLRMEVVIRLAPAKEPKAMIPRPVLSFVPRPSVPLLQWHVDVRQIVQPSLAVLFSHFAALQAGFAGFRTPRLLPLTLGALRYNWASGLRAVISL